MVVISVWLILALICVIFMWVLHTRARESSQHPLPPMLPALRLPFIGHAYILLGGTEKLFKTTQKIANECERLGGVIIGYFGSDLYYVITDPDDVATAANACLQKHYAYRFSSYLGDGLVTSSGEIWKRHRKLLDPTFSLPVVLGFLEMFNKQSRRLVSKLEPYAGGPAFDAESLVKTITSETFCLTAFGGANVSDITVPYMNAVFKLMHLAVKRFINIHLQSDLIYKLVGYKKIENDIRELIDNLYKQVITIKRSQMLDKESKSEAKYQPFLDLLLSMDGDLSDEEIKDEVNTAIAAGFDTTSITVTFSLLSLGAHPDVQDKLLKEVLEVVGQDGDVEKEHLNQLVYTEAVIKEALRCYVPAVGLLRYVDKDVKLKNYTMRAGSQLLLMPLGTNYHPAWGLDRQQFKPERWLDKASAAQMNKAFGSFSWGKRSCIGKTFALVSVKVMMAHLIRRYRVKEVDLSKITYRLDFILRMTSGNEMALERRT